LDSLNIEDERFTFFRNVGNQIALLCLQSSEEQTTQHSVVENSKLTGWYWA